MRDSFSTISRIESCTDAGSRNATEWEKMTGWVNSAMCSETGISETNRARMYRAFDTYGCNKSFFEELEASYAYLRTTKDEEVYCKVSLRPDVNVRDPFTTAVTKIENADCNVAISLFNMDCSMEPTICASDEAEEGEVSELQRMRDDYASYECSDTANEKVQPYLAQPVDVTASGVSSASPSMPLPPHPLH